MKHSPSEVVETLESIQEVIEPVVTEIEGEEEVARLRETNDYMDNIQVILNYFTKKYFSR